ncbi:MAG TPA: type II secretion system F family protein [Bryobacteraceae bacterium]|nr:type II secretion system F family protein [Bryobacteraceae bacterium]
MSLQLLISIALFAMLMAGITAYGYRRYARPGRILEQIGSPVIRAAPDAIVGTFETEEGGVVRVLRQIGQFIPISPVEGSIVKRSLIMAGYRGEHAVAVLYGLKVVGAVCLLLLALMCRDMLSSPVNRMMMLVAGGGMGYFLPGFLLSKRVTARQERLRLSLPDALDLMVVSVEAGLGLDQAIMHVSRELQAAHPELCEEWSLVNLEMRAGTRRAEALRHLAERTGEPDLKKLVAVLVQNDRFGTSMAESLRAHSDFMRTRRRQEAEERAAKVGVKLVFPIFFFILPSMMIVTAGPAMLQLFKHLFPMMKELG